ncbi:MAG: hypothetical protein R3B91_11155 [Planctomycetaceae bacterium]
MAAAGRVLSDAQDRTSRGYGSHSGATAHACLAPLSGEQGECNLRSAGDGGLDWPLASAAATLELEAGRVRTATIVLGHVAPTPWFSLVAADVLVGQPVTPQLAQAAGDAAVSEATPLSENAYKVRLAQTSVKRALLKATNQLEGGL